jgi:hypothetical protein
MDLNKSVHMEYGESIMVGRVWHTREAHFMLTRKQRERERENACAPSPGTLKTCYHCRGGDIDPALALVTICP